MHTVYILSLNYRSIYHINLQLILALHSLQEKNEFKKTKEGENEKEAATWKYMRELGRNERKSRK